MYKISELISTGIYVGYFPKAPGTFGSLTASLIIWMIGEVTGLAWYYCLVLAALTFFIGIIAVDVLLKDSKEKDPGYVVVDEWAGVFTTACFAPISLENIIVGFILFRIFDISKIFPVNKAEKLKGSLGVMADDIIAGVYAGICLWIWHKFI